MLCLESPHSGASPSTMGVQLTHLCHVLKYRSWHTVPRARRRSLSMRLVRASEPFGCCRRHVPQHCGRDLRHLPMDMCAAFGPSFSLPDVIRAFAQLILAVAHRLLMCSPAVLP